jgi:transcription initiation factor TFIIIB Brf1 subunit/transcription initiation factor TFIIB
MFMLDDIHENQRGSVLLTKAIKRFQDILCLDSTGSNAIDYIERFSTKLGFDDHQRNEAKQAVYMMIKNGSDPDHSPNVIAATSLWLHRNKHSTSMQDLANVCHVSQTSIQICSKKMKHILDTHVSEEANVQ